jgi:hypothetical protein
VFWLRQLLAGHVPRRPGFSIPGQPARDFDRESNIGTVFFRVREPYLRVSLHQRLILAYSSTTDTVQTQNVGTSFKPTGLFIKLFNLSLHKFESFNLMLKKRNYSTTITVHTIVSNKEVSDASVFHLIISRMHQVLCVRRRKTRTLKAWRLPAT